MMEAWFYALLEEIGFCLIFVQDILVCYMIYSLKAWSYCILLKRTQIQNFIFLLWEETEICVISALHLMTSTVIVEAFFICAQFREQSMLWGWLYADLWGLSSVPFIQDFYAHFQQLCDLKPLRQFSAWVLVTSLPHGLKYVIVKGRIHC